MSARTWRLEALDTWFFRESRPHGAVGASELASVFPPPARTVAGAVRTLMGEHAGVNWAAFKQKDGRAHDLDGVDLIEQIGYGDETGGLTIDGPWLVRDGIRLYPAPLFLMQTKNSEGLGARCHRLSIGPAAQCDLGNVRLPVLYTSGAKPLENTWLTAAGFAKVLAGGLPGSDEIIPGSELFSHEPRLGIARDSRTRTHLAGQLYQTRHVRPCDKVAVEVAVGGVDPRLQSADRLARLGGEGRLASVSIQNNLTPLPQSPRVEEKDAHGLILILLTPADLGGAWCPPGFERAREKGVDIWHGEIEGVNLKMISAVLGKAQREGGWDLVKQAPRAVKSLIPAGSAWYCEVDGDMRAAIDALHGAKIGHEPSLGRGRLAVGLWNEHGSA